MKQSDGRIGSWQQFAIMGRTPRPQQPEDAGPEKSDEPDAPPLLEKTADEMTFEELQEYRRHLELLAECRRLEEFTGFAAGQNGRRRRNG